MWQGGAAEFPPRGAARLPRIVAALQQGAPVSGALAALRTRRRIRGAAAALSAGTITATAGDGQVTIAQGSAPSGGSGGSYTRTLYRSLAEAALGDLVGTVTLPYVDTGRTNGVPLYYTLRVSDGTTTADTPQVGPRTPVAVGGGAAPDFSDDFSAGAKHSTAVLTWGQGNAVPVTSTNPPPGATHALAFDYFAGPGHPIAEERFVMQPATELWFEWMWGLPPASSGATPFSMAKELPNKFFALWSGGANDYSAAGGLNIVQEFWWRASTSTPGALDIYPRVVMIKRDARPADGTSTKHAGQITNAALGTHVRMRVHVKLASSATATDGFYRCWRDDVLILSLENFGIWPASDAYPPSLSAGYLMGEHDGEYPYAVRYTAGLFDRWTSNPGWG